MNPEVSVLMSVYNGERYLNRALQSLLEQSFTDFEIVLIDDGSTDRSREIMGSYSDPRIRIVDQENRGLTKSLNRAASVARGEFLARQDADDLSLPDRLETQVEFLNRAPEAVAVGSDWETIDGEGKVRTRQLAIVRDVWLRATLPIGNRLCHGAMTIRRSAFERAGGYDERYRYSQDYELWWRMARIGRLYHIPRVLYRHRQHETSVTSRHGETQIEYAQEIRRQVIREWLSDPKGYEEVIHRWGEDDPAVDSLPDDFAAERKRLMVRYLGELAVCLCFVNRPEEARRVLREAAALRGGCSREWILASLMRVMPATTRNWLVHRSRRFPFYDGLSG